MKIKVGDKIYDGEKEAIMVILTPEDKKNISDMHPDNIKYCQYPDDEEWTANSYEKIKKWMAEI